MFFYLNFHHIDNHILKIWYRNMFENKYSKHSENSQYFQNILEIKNFPKSKIDSLHSARRPESVPERRLISKIFSTRRGGALPS